MLEGGASVTVCTSEVDKDVRELSGTLDTGGPDGLADGTLDGSSEDDGTGATLVGGMDAGTEIGGTEIDGVLIAVEVDGAGIDVEIGANADVDGTDDGVDSASGTLDGAAGVEGTTDGVEGASGTVDGAAGVDKGVGGVKPLEVVRLRTSMSDGAASGDPMVGGPPFGGPPSDGPP